MEIVNKMAVVRGEGGLTGAWVKATDLRAGAGLVVAGLGAEGMTVIEDVAHIDRGYERMDDKLASVGADIKRVRM